MARLRWVLYRGVSRAGDCIFKKSLCSGLWYDYSVVFPLLVTIFNEALLSLCPGLWYDYSVVFPLLVTIFNEALLSLCPGLWYDYAGSYTVVFPVLGAPLLVGGALLFLLPCVAPVSLHD